MKYLVGLLFVGACGASQQQLTETPTATTSPRVHEEAPPASVTDVDRNGVRETFQQMENSQNAYREIRNERGEAAGSAAGSAVVPAPPAAPPKKGPAVEAPKTGPAEQAPKS